MDFNRQEYPNPPAGIASLLRNSVVILSLISLLAILTACSQSPCQNPNASTEACIADLKTNPNKEIAQEWVESAAEREDVEQLKRAGELPLEVEDRVEVLNLAAEKLYRLGEFEAAYDHYVQVVSLLEGEGASEQLASAYYNAADQAWGLSEYREALEYSDKALKALPEGDKDLEIKILFLVSSLFGDLGNYGPSRYALSILDEILGNEISGDRINAYISLGISNKHVENYALELFYYKKALAAAAGSDNKGALSSLHLNVSRAYMDLGRLNLAEEHLAKALELNEGNKYFFAHSYMEALLYLHKGNYDKAQIKFLESLSDPYGAKSWEPEIYYGAGKSAQGLRDVGESLEYFSKSIAVIEQLTLDSGLTSITPQTLKLARKSYNAMFEILVEDGAWEEAFEISERAKRTNYSAALIMQSLSGLESVSESLPLSYASHRVEALGGYVQRLLIPSFNLSSDVLKSSSLPGDTAYISYYKTDAFIYVLTNVNNKIKILKSSVKPSELDELIIASQESPNNKKLLEELGAALFPDGFDFYNYDHLYISPDEAINGINLSSVIVDERFLVEFIGSSLVPGMEFFSRSDWGEGQEELPSLFLGDPTSNLPGARAEVLKNGGLLGGEIVVGDSALISKVLARAPLDLLHISGHSGIDHLGPWIDLADGRLYGHEIEQYSSSVRVAMLASCKSVVPSNGNVWGSLAGSFLNSGANSVVASRRSIDDVLINQLVDQFYIELEKNNRVSTALMNAQQWAIEQGFSPSEWDSFQLLGY